MFVCSDAEGMQGDDFWVPSIVVLTQSRQTDTGDKDQYKHNINTIELYKYEIQILLVHKLSKIINNMPVTMPVKLLQINGQCWQKLSSFKI